MPNEESTIELIWGINAIARLIGRTDRQAFHMVSTGQLPAKKVGGRWVAERSKLIAFFMDDVA
jgi:hypothetical protein